MQWKKPNLGTHFFIISSKNAEVIKQGENGDVLYLVDSGTLDCFKSQNGNDEMVKVRDYKSGDAFGELALLYNAPRAATIIATSECLLWSLDRETFNFIVKEAAM